MTKNPYLIEPTPALVTEFRAMALEWNESTNSRYRSAFGNFETYVETLKEQARDVVSRPNRVPTSSFWLIDQDNQVLGTSRLRHRLVPHLEIEGGHIGYDIRPSKRKMGYGTTLLRLMLLKAKEIGLDKVLVTCDHDNIGSARIIEKNGGQETSRTISGHSGKEIKRYWISL